MTPVEATIEEIFQDDPPFLQEDLEEIIQSKEIKPRHKLFAQVRANGATIPEAARVIGVCREQGYRIEKGLAQGSILVNPKMLRLGAKSAKTIFTRFLEGTNRLAPQVTALVIRQEDSINPKLIRSQSLNVNLDISAVDYSSFVDRYSDEK